MTRTTSGRRALPAVETVLGRPALAPVLSLLPRPLVVEAVRAELAAERRRLARDQGPPPEVDGVARAAAERARAAARPVLRRVINATGVVLHTNLGRAPLSAAARAAVASVAAGYSNLEYDLDRGARGDRGRGVERWLTRLTGAESAAVVNNGAAALLVTLSALASGRRVAVSRGELVEIGGSFRIPEVLEKSGARLHEVGTTNRTHLRDYARALDASEPVAAILRVHPSNFRVSGFTARPDLAELAALAHRHRVPLIEDLGSGALVDLSSLGLEREPTVNDSLTAGCDVVTFSGDKLLGAPQAGLILGRRRWIERIRRDPLARALRVDKLTLAALEATLPAFLDPARAVSEIPALAMLGIATDELERRAHVLAGALVEAVPGLTASVVAVDGEVGGGSLPMQRLPGFAVTASVEGVSARTLEQRARAADPPVIGYLRSSRFVLDVRTLTDDDMTDLPGALAGVWRDPRQEERE